MTAPLFSLWEVFPPRRDAPVGTIYDTLDGLQGLAPAFISVTYGTGKSKDRTATARIANTIRGEYRHPRRGPSDGPVSGQGSSRRGS